MVGRHINTHYTAFKLFAISSMMGGRTYKRMMNSKPTNNIITHNQENYHYQIK